MSAVRLSPLAALALVVAATSCDGTQPTDMGHGHDHSVSAVKYDSDLANQIKGGLARFNSRTQAEASGYAEASPCVSISAGGMGHHWVKGPIVDPVFDAANPEALLYDASGKLIGVEYIVINVGQPAPTFGSQAFDVGGSPVPVAHWTLHVWLFESNSNGLFNPWNPAVACS